MNPTLLVLAAGMGSRYGGLKQLDPVGPAGETILDYSVHDALRAGFGRVVFVIRREFEEEFRRTVVSRYADRVATACVFQALDDLPDGFNVPPGRTKPWGTAQAILAARHAIDTPFAAINADDFYGADAFVRLGDFLRPVPPASTAFAMVGYRLCNTLSEHGTVARGLCRVSPDGLLEEVEELTGIARQADGQLADTGKGVVRPLTGQEIVSMNFWGFTPGVFPLLQRGFSSFLKAHGPSASAEYYIPSAVSHMIATDQATVRVLATDAAWFGVTYREDRPQVVASLARLTASGTYPSPLGAT